MHSGRTEASTYDRSVEDVATLSGDPVVNEARRFLDRCDEWYSESDRRTIEDLKFAEGDAENGYQWPNSIRMSRDIDQRPCLTLNFTRQHNLQIINQSAQAKSQIKINPTGGGASAESAQAFKWVVQHIERQSNAQLSAYKIARNFQVKCGKGFWRIITDYASPDTFDQEIFIRPIRDPLSVRMDPDCREPDCSDARQAIIFDVIPRAEFFAAYPDLRSMIGDEALGTGSTGGDWLPKDTIIICEYFRKVPKMDKLISFVFRGERHTVRQSLVPPAIRGQLLDDPLTRVRDTWDDEVEWYLIAGQRVIDSTVWLGKYIPIIRIIGEESVIDGIYDVKGHTRALKDAQRMYNYNASAQVEYGALQSKTPWVVDPRGIEDYRTLWESANLINHAYLPYKHMDQQYPETPIPPPFRQEPPNFAPAFEKGMDTAFNQGMMTSGQWQNQMGMMGNERTGAAIQKRQDQGDTATYHFQEEYASGLRFTGVQLIDLVPKIYNTRRIKRIVTDEGLEFDLLIDPAQRNSYMQQQNHMDEVITRVFNPQVGQYDVSPDVGPAIGTRREENVEALTLILTQAPALTGIIGDILLRNMDIGEDGMEAARRLRRMVPPQALGQGPTPTEQQQQQIIQQLQEALTKAMQRAGADRIKLVDKQDKSEIETYRAETDRIKALADMLPTDPQGLQEMIEQLVKDTLATHLLPLLGRSLPAPGDGVPDPKDFESMGARQAPDGEWYLQDPTKQGRYLRVVPLAQERKAKNVVANR